MITRTHNNGRHDCGHRSLANGFPFINAHPYREASLDRCPIPIRTTSTKILIAFALAAIYSALNSVAFAEILPKAKPEEAGISSAKVGKLSSHMQSLVDEGKIAGGVTMMARHGKVVHLKAVGLADRRKQRLMTTDAIFRIASMTKPVTSVAVMMLWEEGRIGLDDPVSKYIPEFKKTDVLVSVDPWATRPAKQEITIRHLLTHTSGIGYHATPTIGSIYLQRRISGAFGVSSEPLEKAMKRLANVPLLFDPGERVQYGMSTNVLGRVVEVASEMPFERFIEDHICRPLGMTDSYFKVPKDKLARLAAAYVPGEDSQIRKLGEHETTIHGGVPISSRYPYDEGQKFFSGGGGLCSTATDYMRFCQMLLNGGSLNNTRLLRQDTVKLMTTNQIGDLAIPKIPDKFGFGVAVLPDNDNIHEQLRGAYGWAGFWSTSFRISPRGDWILITMTQLAWDDQATPSWFAEYEKIAADAVMNGVPK